MVQARDIETPPEAVLETALRMIDPSPSNSPAK
jgi:hypothetical protein